MAAVVLVFGGCSDDDSTSPPDSEPFFPENFRDTYTIVRDARRSVDHPDSIIVYCDPFNANAYVNGIYPLAEGAIVVKTRFESPAANTVTGYDVMAKGPSGTSPDGGDWIWQEIDANRRVIREGIIQDCISCHTACQDDDFLCTEGP